MILSPRVIRRRTEVSLRFMDPCMFMLTMPKPIDCNVGCIGFPELPWCPWPKVKFGFCSVLARVEKEVPYDATCVRSVSLTQRKMECNSLGSKTCNSEALETLGRVATTRATWDLVRGLPPSRDQIYTLVVSEWWDIGRDMHLPINLLGYWMLIMMFINDINMNVMILGRAWDCGSWLYGLSLSLLLGKPF